MEVAKAGMDVMARSAMTNHQVSLSNRLCSSLRYAPYGVAFSPTKVESLTGARNMFGAVTADNLLQLRKSGLAFANDNSMRGSTATENRHFPKFPVIASSNKGFAVAPLSMSKYNDARFSSAGMSKVNKANYKRFSCENCDRTFLDSSSLQRHIRQQHHGARAHPCAECGKAFGTASGLKQHQHIHSSVKPFTCEVCHKAYTQFSNLCRHKRMHADCRAQIRCRNCRHQFPNSNTLNKHRRFCTAGGLTKTVIHHRPTATIAVSGSGKVENQIHETTSTFFGQGTFHPVSMPPRKIRVCSESVEERPKTDFSVVASTLYHGTKVHDKSAQAPCCGETRRLYHQYAKKSVVDAGVQCSSPTVDDSAREIQENGCIIEPNALRFKAASNYEQLDRHQVSDASVQVDLSNEENMRSSDISRKAIQPTDIGCGQSANRRERIWHPLLSPSTKSNTPSDSATSDRFTQRQHATAGAVAAAILYQSSLERRAHSERVVNHRQSAAQCTVRPVLDEPLDLSIAKKKSEKVNSNRASLSTFSWRNPLSLYYDLGKNVTGQSTTDKVSPSPPVTTQAQPSVLFPWPSFPWCFQSNIQPAYAAAAQYQAPSFRNLVNFSSLFNGVYGGSVPASVCKLNAVSPHQSRVGRERYTCKFCHKVFPRSANLTRHERTHTGEQPYTCTYCDRSFSISSNLQRHVRNIHNNERPYPCHLCGRAFGQQTNLDRHLRNHLRDSATDAPHKFSDGSAEAHSSSAEHSDANNNSTAKSSCSSAPCSPLSAVTRATPESISQRWSSPNTSIGSIAEQESPGCSSKSSSFSFENPMVAESRRTLERFNSVGSTELDRDFRPYYSTTDNGACPGKEDSSLRYSNLCLTSRAATATQS